MNVLVVGSGGREHALAWKAAQSPRVERLYIAPGNAGTASVGQNVPIAADDVTGLVAFCRQQKIDLVLIGPEAALALGLADELALAGIRAFGPTQAAARIETSKAFAKEFMRRHDIPTARFARFRVYEEALEYLREVDGPVVVKASGLAAGKGVIVPESRAEAELALRTIMVERAFGAAGDEVIIEERLSGEEVSLLAFTDGCTISPMPPAQDHKRLLDGDRGPNTGGMGAYAPAPICPPELVEQVCARILQPAVDGLRAEGTPFSGVLYAGVILTPDGPQVLEFNCRFGDPETQALLPLLDSDLVEIAEACIDGQLHCLQLRWKPAAAACVALASEGYPGKVTAGQVITGLDTPFANVLVFHAGTRLEDGRVLTDGGRVLNVTGVGATLSEALSAAYRAISGISFEGMHYRRDIGARALQAAPPASAYTASGVNIDAGNRAVEQMKAAVRSTYTPEVLAGIGAFGGLYDAAALRAMRAPVLVASTDGVGTKVRLAAAAGRYEPLGEDIVNHCINDILVQGARPLFFLDYFATARLDPEIAARVVAGIAAACRAAGCALLGGETAEMPGVYAEGEFDIAGTIVGIVERERILPRAGLRPGDLLVGLRSSGPHTNGYSLIRKVFTGVPLDTVYPELGVPLADALLAPHRSYLPVLADALALDPTPVKALAHLTGGGFIENIPRVLPEGLRAVIHLGSWPIPPLFNILQRRGAVTTAEMYRVFNMGIGMIAVIAPEDLTQFQACLPEESWVIGELAAGPTGVELR